MAFWYQLLTTQSIWFWLCLGLLVLLLIYFLFFHRRSQTNPLPQKPIPPSATPPDETTSPTQTAEPSSPSRHWFSHTHFAPLFKTLLSQLRQQVSGRDYRYEIPWIVQIGEQNSGKSTLLHDTGLDAPFGVPVANEHGCDAWLFEKGIVFDLAGQYVLNAQAGSDEAGWRDFLLTLRRFRPKRPLDGVIVTIAADELLARTTQPDTTKNKANHLYHKLRSMQKTLGMRLPIYIVLTRCDQLEGFTTFTNALPERLRNQLFGWSNPYALETAYSEQWLDEAFQTIYHAINALQLELITSDRDIADKDAFLRFPHQFRPLLQQLKGYTNALFRPSVYHEPFYWRGIYCCGDGLENTPDYVHKDACSDEIQFEAQMHEKPRQRYILFLHHLFRDKIFAEQTLARPVRSILRGQQHRLRFMQLAFILGGVLLLVWQWQVYETLKYQKEQQIQPTLQQIIADKQAEQNARTPAEKVKSKRESAKNLVSSLSQIQTHYFGAALLPASWFSALNARIQQALTTAYQDFIAEWLYVGLKQKINTLLTLPAHEEPTAVPPQGYTQMTQPPDYQKLDSLLTALTQFQAQTGYYNSLVEEIGVDDKLLKIEAISAYIYQVKTNITDAYDDSLAAQALRQTRYFKAFKLQSYQHPARQYVAQLIQRWLAQFFSHNSLLLELQRVNNMLQQASQQEENANTLLASLRDFEQAINSIEARFANPQWQWVEAKQIRDIPEFQAILVRLTQIPLLGKKFSDTQHTLADQAFQVFRDELVSAHKHMLSWLLGHQNKEGSLSASTPKITAKQPTTPKTALAGSVDSDAQAQTIAITPTASGSTATEKSLIISSEEKKQIKQNLTAIDSVLESFLAQNFMREIPPQDITTGVSPSQFLFWHSAELQTADDLIQSYQKFMAEELSKAPVELQTTLRSSGVARMRDNLRHLIAKAQDLRSQPLEKTLQEEVLRSNSSNFAQTVPLLSKLLTFIQHHLPAAQDLQVKLRQLLTQQATHLLARADVLLSEAHLYEPIGFGLNVWQGELPLSHRTFDVSDHEELKYLLKLSAERVAFLLQNYADVPLQYLQQQAGHITAPALVPKWHQISQTITAHKNKKPDNTLSLLEKFILFGLDKISPANCFDAVNAGRPHGQQDYFTRKQIALQQRVFQRCAQLAEESSFNHYSVIAGFFNERLAGHFPFVAVTPDDGELASLDPMQLQDFYGILQLYQQNLQQQIENVPAFGAARHRAVQFLEQVDFAQPLFQDFIGTKPKLPYPEYGFQVAFRVNREHEKGANQILSWEMRVDDTPIKQIKGRWQGRWKFGQSVSVHLRWARNSAFRPRWDGSPSAQVYEQASETEAVFHYRSQWALLEMLARQRPAPEAVKTPEYQRETLVQLTVPVVQLVAALKPEQMDNAEVKPLPTDNASSTREQTDKTQPKIVLYQGQYRSLFEVKDTAVVFLEVKLFSATKAAQAVTLTTLPTQAPMLQLDAVNTDYLPPHPTLKLAPPPPAASQPTNSATPKQSAKKEAL